MNLKDCVRLNETKAFDAQFFHFCVKQRLIRIGRLMQGRIHTGFHRFTKICQIFQNYSENPLEGTLGIKKNPEHFVREPISEALVASEIGHHLS